MEKYSIVFKKSEYILQSAMPSFFHDLNLDQVVKWVTVNREDFNLNPFYYTILNSIDDINYRQMAAKEIENEELTIKSSTFSYDILKCKKAINDLLSSTTETIDWVSRTTLVKYIDIYKNTIIDYNNYLKSIELKSDAFKNLHVYLSEYLLSDDYLMMLSDMEKLQNKLSNVHYTMLMNRGRISIRSIDVPDEYYDDIITQAFMMGRTSDRKKKESDEDSGSISIAKYDHEPDFSEKIKIIAEKFQINDFNNYISSIPDEFLSSRVENDILEVLSSMYQYEFKLLISFYQKYNNFFNDTMYQLAREIQFYVSYNQFIENISATGLFFNYPSMTIKKGECYAKEIYDIALAYNNIGLDKQIITNDYMLENKERIIIISGPNQGGKTTYARAVAQMYYLAALGLKTPGAEANLFLIDNIFTHFEIEETSENMDGKLKQELSRVKNILDKATDKSLLIINEIFSSTSLQDAIFIGKKLIDIVNLKNSICLFVTFIEELSRYNESTVSMTSTVLLEMPDIRTYKIVRRIADGKSFAISVAKKYHLSYDEIKRRIKSCE